MILALPQIRGPIGSRRGVKTRSSLFASRGWLMSRHDVYIEQAIEERDSLAEPLAPTTLCRINLVRHSFADVMPDTLAQVLERFRRDTYPERELLVWERMAAVYLDFKQVFKPEATRGRAAFLVLLELSMGRVRARTRKQRSVLSPEEFKFLCARWEVFGPQATQGIKQIH
jgi:AcrR family transcriptional regulator